MIALAAWIRSIFCAHVFQSEEKNMTLRNTKNVVRTDVFEQCILCGWHRTYTKWDAYK